jgi:predicted nucleotidyltransferase
MVIELENDNYLNRIFENHMLEKVYLFGSMANGNYSNTSDIDLLIHFKPGLEPLKRGELLWSLYDILRDYFHREVDLVNESNIKNPYFLEEINRTKKLIYG